MPASGLAPHDLTLAKAADDDNKIVVVLVAGVFMPTVRTITNVNGIPVSAHTIVSNLLMIFLIVAFVLSVH